MDLDGLLTTKKKIGYKVSVQKTIVFVLFCNFSHLSRSMANLSPLSSLSSPMSGAEGDLSTPIFLAIIAPLKISSGVLLVLSMGTAPPSLAFLVLGLRGVQGYPSLYTYCSSGGGGASVIRDSLEPPVSLFASGDVNPSFPGCKRTSHHILD